MKIIDEYIELQNKYTNQFGNKTLVLMEIGGFFLNIIILITKKRSSLELSINTKSV